MTFISCNSAVMRRGRCPSCASACMAFLKPAGAPAQWEKLEAARPSLKHHGCLMLAAQQRASLSEAKRFRMRKEAIKMRHPRATRKEWGQAVGRLEFAAMLIAWVSAICPVLRAVFLAVPEAAPTAIVACPPEADSALQRPPFLLGSDDDRVWAPFSFLAWGPSTPAVHFVGDAPGTVGCGGFYSSTYFMKGPPVGRVR